MFSQLELVPSASPGYVPSNNYSYTALMFSQLEVVPTASAGYVPSK
jgi:hypothetical protein